MKYELVYTPRAVKDIKGLDHKVKDRIGKTILRYTVSLYKAVSPYGETTYYSETKVKLILNTS